jgi:hypothetical protein
MSTSASLLTVLTLSFAAAGCAPQRACPAAAATTTTTRATLPPEDRHVYRLDFVLATTDRGGSPQDTSFSLNLRESEKGEVMIGKNVAVAGPSPVPGPTPGTSGAVAALALHGAARQDVGLKVHAQFRTLGDDVLLEVLSELSAFDAPSTVRKIAARGNALAVSGKSAVVAVLEDDHKRYQLSVTPTKLR